MVAAWVLNLDADLELARPRGYAPPARVARRVAASVGGALALLGPGDVRVEPGDRLPDALRGVRGSAWCPTPWATRVLRDAGAQPAPAPSLEVLRAANHRRFGAELGGGPQGSAFVTTAAEVDVRLGRPVVLKRAHGFAGRGQRRLRAAPTDDDRRWIEASLRAGGLLVEPWVDIVDELSVHGRVGEDGAVVVGAPCVQEVDSRGAWRSTRRASAGELEPAELSALEAGARRVAGALAAIGYFGPFGVDGYRYRDGATRRLVALGEVNARYTMGWAVGMAGVAAG